MDRRAIDVKDLLLVLNAKSLVLELINRIRHVTVVEFVVRSMDSARVSVDMEQEADVEIAIRLRLEQIVQSVVMDSTFILVLLVLGMERVLVVDWEMELANVTLNTPGLIARRNAPTNAAGTARAATEQVELPSARAKEISPRQIAPSAERT